MAPRLRPKRILVFGDSIVEGVGAEAAKGRNGDLIANAGAKTWVVALAERMDAEYSSVGYGRQGFTVRGNGNVPPFAASGVEADEDCSWDKLWAGRPRFASGATSGAASGAEAEQGTRPQLDLVLIMHGTCDGLIAGESASSAVRIATAALLPRLRAALGPQPKLFLCVPFGGVRRPQTATSPRAASGHAAV